jgi:hypothetical protein
MREGPLPLADAWLAWGDPALVVAYRAATEVSRPPAPPGRQGWLGVRGLGRTPGAGSGWLGSGRRDADDLRQEAIDERRRAHLADIDAEIRRSQAALVADFRARIGRGEIRLTGLQIEPVLDRKRTELSPAWSSRMKLLFQRARVTVGSTVFVDVTAERIRPATPAASASTDTGVPGRTEERDDKQLAKGRKGPAGRKSANGLIKDILRGRWETVRAEAARASSGKPNIKALAASIAKQLRKRQAGHAGLPIPQESTIRRNLPEIYEDLVREIGCGESKPPQ